VKKSQSNFEDTFPKIENTKDTPMLTGDSSVEDKDTSTVSKCCVFKRGHESTRRDGENLCNKKTVESTSGYIWDGAERSLKSPSESPDKSLNISLQNDSESKNSAVSRNLYTVTNAGNTLSDNLRNVSVLCRTSDLSQDDFSVSDSVDAETCFSRGSSVVPEDMSKASEAGESIKDSMDFSEKAYDDDDVTFNNKMECSSGSDSDRDVTDKTKGRKRAVTRCKFTSYNKAHEKCGLILCDFPTVSNSLFKGMDVNDRMLYVQ
jgi:hypothetical protein